MPQQPIDDDVADFLDDTDWTHAVILNATSILNRWTRWCAERHVAVRAVGRRDLRDYLDHRADTGIGAATRRKEWQIISAFYAWAARPRRPRHRDDRPGGGLLRDDPTLGVKGPHVSSKPRTRTAKGDEVERLLDAFGTDETGRRNQAMVSLMWRSGLRVGELPGIDLADVVDWGTTGRQVILLAGEDTKSGEPRRVPVHPETQRLLGRYLRKRGRLPGPLFMGRAGHTRDRDGRLTTRAVQMVMTRAARKQQVPLSSHQLRRGFVAQYLRASRGDVLGLEIIGGWADHRMPRIYLADEEAQAGVDRFFDVFDQPAPPSKRRLRSVGDNE